MKDKSCGNCGWITDGGGCGYPFKEGFPCNQKYWKPKDKTMSDKIQMTEEQARELFEYLGFSPLGGIIKDLKKGNYIIKSELQQKVERVEASLEEYIDGHSVDILDTFKASIDVIQLLKQSHPEFKEK